MFCKVFIHITFLLSLSLCKEVLAADVIEEFSIKPSLCIVEQDEQCHRRFIFYWRLREPLEACLFAKNKEVAIHCETASEVTIVREIELGMSQWYELRALEQNKSEAILVRQLRSEVRQVRRHIWSVF
ncbi:DUF3019 domain-containing protein [Pseudoalteromonas sp. GB56]